MSVLDHHELNEWHVRTVLFGTKKTKYVSNEYEPEIWLAEPFLPCKHSLPCMSAQQLFQCKAKPKLTLKKTPQLLL